MKLALKVFVGLVSVGFLLTGCLGTESDYYEPIEGALYVDMVEQLDSDTRILNVILETEKEYSCSNYTFDVSYAVEDDSIAVVKLKRIYKGSYCYAAQGPARLIMQYAVGNWDKKYIRFEMDNFEKSVVIVKDTSEYLLDMVDTEDFMARRNELKRVPANTIWGIMAYSSDSSNAYIDTFYNYLDTIGATAQVYEDGDYYFFEVEDGTIVNPSELVKSSAFIRNYMGSFSEVGYIAYDLWSDTDGDVGVYVGSSENEYVNYGYY